MTDGRTDGGDCNIPDAFLKKRGDKNLSLAKNQVFGVFFSSRLDGFVITCTSFR